MPAISLGLLAALAVGAWAMLGGKKGSGPAAGPPGTPEGDYSEDALKALTEYVNTSTGSVRYFRTSFVPSILVRLNSLTVSKVSEASTTGGTATLFRLDPITAGQSTATAVAVAAVNNHNLAVLVSLNVWVPNTESLYMMTVPLAARSLFATHGKPWAALLDKERAQATVPPPGGTGPTTPAIPPGVVPPGGTGPTTPAIPPGVVPPGGIPAIPPGIVPPANGECQSQIDAHMPASTKTLSCLFIHNPASSIEALKLASTTFRAQGYPKAAGMCDAEILRRGGTPDVPGVTPPTPQSGAGWPFKIRENDIPYQLALYYTGEGGRVKEILDANPGMKSVTKTQNGKKITFYQPWNVGSIIKLPQSWPVDAKPLPKPATTTASTIPYVPPA